MDTLDVLRIQRDGSVAWIGSAKSLPTALEMINALMADPSDTFLIHDSRRNNTLTVRADELPSYGVPCRKHA
jgi:hypothetical protein